MITLLQIHDQYMDNCTMMKKMALELISTVHFGIRVGVLFLCVIFVHQKYPSKTKEKSSKSISNQDRLLTGFGIEYVYFSIRTLKHLKHYIKLFLCVKDDPSSISLPIKNHNQKKSNHQKTVS